MDAERWFRFLLAVLATWRLTHLVTCEDGPGDVLASLREWIGDGFFGTLMDCFFCASLWVAAPVACWVMNRWREWPWLWLALSGAACLLERPDKDAHSSQNQA
jgi:hypothetical protein